MCAPKQGPNDLEVLYNSIYVFVNIRFCGRDFRLIKRFQLRPRQPVQAACVIIRLTMATSPKFVRWAVLIGIVIALNLFFFVGRSLLLPEPKFEDYCPARMQPAATESACAAQDGVWVPTEDTTGAAAPVKPGTLGYCDFYQKCQPIYDAAHKQWAMYSFVIAIGLGVLSIMAGVIPMGSSIVSSGLSYGGVLAFIIAATSYWNEAGDLLKFGISGVALIALLYIGARRFRD